jgi:lysylphosphatidylglycerol synthetase-like protein (DUF2156 family)
MQASAPTKNKYWGYVRGLGGAAIISAIIGVLFNTAIRPLLSERVRNEVIITAVPFIAVFAAILLLFIMSVALLGVRFHVTVPARTHSAVEYTIIASILIGVVALFQSWSIAPYTFGLGLLLFSVLAFIVWSHIAPRNKRENAALPKFTSQAKTIGVIAGLVVTMLVFGSFALNTVPKEPYGVRQRQWNTYRDEQKAEAKAEAQIAYRNSYLPFFIIYGALPGLVVFFLTRELTTAKPKSSES